MQVKIESRNRPVEDLTARIREHRADGKTIDSFLDDISLCPRWSLVDFYIDYGSSAPHMESSKEWCRLLTDCFAGRVDLIVTQKAGNVSEDPQELAWISRLLAAQKPPVGIY